MLFPLFPHRPHLSGLLILVRFYARSMSLKIILMSFYQTVTVTCTLDGRVDEKVFPWNETQLPLTRGAHKTWNTRIATYRMSKKKIASPVEE
jgi:hypothetical protein